MPPCKRRRWMDPSSETQESAHFCSGEIHASFFYPPEFIYSNLSEAVIIFVSGDKRRRETATICSLFKGRALKSCLWGGVFGAGLGDDEQFFPCTMRTLKCTFAFRDQRKPFRAHQFSFLLLQASRKDYFTANEKIPFL